MIDDLVSLIKKFEKDVWVEFPLGTMVVRT